MTSPIVRISQAVLAVWPILFGSYGALADTFGLCPPNTVVAGPANGQAAAPACRALINADIPPTLIPTIISPLQYNARGDGITDDTAAMQATINAAVGIPIYLGPHKYKVGPLTISSPIVMTGGGSSGGGGVNSVTCTTGLIANASNITLLTIQAADTRIENICIQMASTFGQNTAGNAISIGALANDTILRGNQINFPFNGIDASGNGTSQLVHPRIEENTITAPSPSGVGILVGRLTTGGNTVDPEITGNSVDCNLTTANSAGMKFQDSGGAFVTRNSIYGCGWGTQIYPTVNQVIEWSYFDHTVLGDSSLVADIDIKPFAASAIILGNNFVDTWASNSSGLASFTVSNPFAAIVDGIHLVGHRTYTNSNQNAITLSDTLRDVTIDASTLCASGTSSGSAVTVGAAVTDFSLRGTRIGVCDHGNNSQALATGVSISAGANNITITGNDFAQTTAPIAWTPAGTEKAKIQANLGMPPAAITSGFGTSPTISGDSFGGRVTVGGGGASSGVIALNAISVVQPVCTAQDETTSNPMRATVSSGSLTITGTMVAADKVTYVCTAM